MVGVGSQWRLTSSSLLSRQRTPLRAMAISRSCADSLRNWYCQCVEDKETTVYNRNVTVQSHCETPGDVGVRIKRAGPAVLCVSRGVQRDDPRVSNLGLRRASTGQPDGITTRCGSQD